MPSMEDASPQRGAYQRDDEYVSVAGNDSGGCSETLVDRLLDRYKSIEGPSAAAAARQQRITLLTRTIESQIIPKLALSHRHLDRAERGAVVDDAALNTFVALVLTHDLAGCSAWMDQLVTRDTGLVDICLDVLAPAARRLGEMWDDDLCSFVDVTAGLGTLHTLLYRLKETSRQALPIRDMSRHILLASLSGDQHTFGLEVVAEVFRNAGWDVAVHAAVAEVDLVRIVSGEWFAIAGVSVARDDQVSSLGQTIRATRLASSNREIGLLVGGPVFAGKPNLARLVGADVTACDAKQAVLQAEGLRLLMAALGADTR